jgi:hypothetical protein
MTQQDEDREAFEAALKDMYGLARSKIDGKYWHGPTAHAFTGWQAARDHYGPQLTEEEAISEVTQALRPFVEPESFPSATVNYAFDLKVREMVKAVLNALGTKFKEEA